MSINNPKGYDSNKIFNPAKLKFDKNKIIGLCVGGYDLLHPGHMKHFESAKFLCDILIVAVTCDKFNSKRKGEGRPIYCENLRAYSVSQIKSVDFVIISEFESASELIKELKPNIYIKGPDYKNKNTPGINSEREAIKSVGGKIMYTEDDKLSTTEIINYIKKNVK